jgi:FKBP-type peptidyl-prolyl cis-trans isomerase FkpA
MKKSPVAPPSSSRPPWLFVALLSLAVNAVLLAWLVARKPEPREAPLPAAPVTVSAPAPVWDREVAPYAALGSFMAENNRIADLKWSPAQFAAFQEGFRASYEGRGLPLDEAAAKLRDETSARVQAMVQGEQPDPVRDYFKFLREKENVQQTPSGLHYRITDEGTGAPPTAADTVVISYAARLPDGKAVPALGRARVKVAVRDLLPGLAEGVQLLKVGGKGLLYLPPSLAFRETDWPRELPRGIPLGFYVELHDINPAR